MKSWERSSPAAVYYLGKSARESQRTAQDSDRIRICIHNDSLSQLERHVSFLGWMAFTFFASFVQSALSLLFPPHSATIGTSTWHKHYCMYTKENKILTMIPYTQTQAGRLVSFAPLLLSLYCWAPLRHEVFHAHVGIQKIPGACNQISLY